MNVPSTNRDTSTRHIVVVGGGIIGLASALALAMRGQRVTVLDRAPGPGAQASGAAAGIISPLYPWEGPAELQALASDSMQRYPAWKDRIERASGLTVGWRRCGLLALEADANAQAQAWAVRYGHRLELLGSDDFTARFPGVSATSGQGLWLPDAACVNPALLLVALAAACQSAGVALCWKASVHSLQQSGVRITGVQLQDGTVVGGDDVVVANGAWAPALLDALGVKSSIRPVRGQIIELQGPEGLLDMMLVSGHQYLLPRAEGKILVGSTAEEVGFDASVTEQVRDSLRAFAVSVLPATAGLPVSAHWAGLRPGSVTGVPTIGAERRLPGLWLNLGHFRSGITLAPASAARLAEAMLDD